MGSKSASSWNVTASSIPSVVFCEILKTEHHDWAELQVRFTQIRKLSQDLEPIAQNFIHISQNLTIARR